MVIPYLIRKSMIIISTMNFVILLKMLMLLMFLQSLSGSPIQSCKPQTMPIEQCRTFYASTGRDVNYIKTEFDARKSLLKTNCSTLLPLLVCSISAPLCQAGVELSPCRSMCLKVQEECESVLRDSNQSWPTSFRCERLSRGPHICVDASWFSVQQQETLSLELVQSSQGSTPSLDRNSGNCSANYVFIRRTGRCALRCGLDGVFTATQRRVARSWLSAVAALTLLCCSVTLAVACAVSRGSTPPPPPPIVFIAFCQWVVSAAELLPHLLPTEAVSCLAEPENGVSVLTQEGLDSTACALTFLPHFFFSVAAGAWWLVAVLGWLLQTPSHAASQAAVTPRWWAGRAHLAVWAATALVTVAVLVSRAVDADELLGLCSVGGQNPQARLRFVVLPQAVCLAGGCLCLLLLSVLTLANRSRQCSSSPLLPFSVVHIAASSLVLALDLQAAGGPQPLPLSLLLVRTLLTHVDGIQTLVWSLAGLCCSSPSSASLPSSTSSFSVTRAGLWTKLSRSDNTPAASAHVTK